MTTLSNKFAYLPNGIIREIISYTGATYKKRNGKYIGQIPKNDIRYALLLTIPKKTFIHEYYSNPNRLYFSTSVLLTHTNYDLDRYDLSPSVYLDVHGIKYVNDSCFGNKEIIEYKLLISDWNGKIRSERFVYYYHNDDRYNEINADIDEKIEKTLLKAKNLRKCIKHILIFNVVVIIGLLLF